MLEVRADRSRHVVCVFNRGPKITYYLGVENGPQLTACQMPNEDFERVYYHTTMKLVAGQELPHTPLDFAMAYMRNAEARRMVPLAPVAIRVLTAIIRGQPTEDALADPSLNSLENEIMAAKEEGGFRKPEGSVAQVHKFLDSKVEQIKAGTVSRKELIDKLVEKGINAATATTQCGVWARTAGVQFVRPTQAAEAKKESRKAAAKKSTGDKKPAKVKKAKATAEAAAA